MATIYRKSARGLAEIETRAARLPPRLRGALILVDGRRSADEIRRLIPVEPEATLQALAAQGFGRFVLSLGHMAALVQEAVRAGAISYLLKNVAGTVLVEAILAAARGQATLADEALNALMRLRPIRLRSGAT